MIGRTLGLALALMGALIGSQAPEFAQQYRQRLGGAVEELGRVVADFDRDAAAAGFDRARAVAAMKQAKETLIQLRGKSIERAIERYADLRVQLDAFEQGGIAQGIAALVAGPDRPLVKATFDNYVPAVPTTPAGLVAAGAGFFAVAMVLSFLRRLLPRRRRRWREEEEDEWA